jgi:hypothetical protein
MSQGKAASVSTFRQAGVAAGRHHRAGAACVGRQIQVSMNSRIDSRGDAVAAGQRLQLFVRVRQAVAAHHRLHGFGQHFPGGVEVGVEALRVRR